MAEGMEQRRVLRVAEEDETVTLTLVPPVGLAVVLEMAGAEEETENNGHRKRYSFT
jgi:hypothetical protein